MGGAPLRMTLVGAMPAYQVGLAHAVADRGFVHDVVESMGAWAAEATETEPRIALVVVGGAPDLDRVVALKGHLHVVVVALMGSLEPGLWLAAAKAGADGIAELAAHPEQIADVAVAAVRGEVRFPVEVYRRHIDLAPHRLDEVAPLSMRERRWLVGLSEGDTIASIAADDGLSTRTLQRRLQNLYVRMGAMNRDHAIRIAAELGLFRESQ